MLKKFKKKNIGEHERKQMLQAGRAKLTSFQKKRKSSNVEMTNIMITDKERPTELITSDKGICLTYTIFDFSVSLNVNFYKLQEVCDTVNCRIFEHFNVNNLTFVFDRGKSDKFKLY